MVENYKIDNTNYCGLCPECNNSWDNGDVIDYLMDPEKYLGAMSSRTISEHIARINYGWTPENKKRISKLVSIEVSDGDELYDGLSIWYQCSDCGIAWHSQTGDRTDMYKRSIDSFNDMKECINSLRNKKCK